MSPELIFQGHIVLRTKTLLDNWVAGIKDKFNIGDIIITSRVETINEDTEWDNMLMYMYSNKWITFNIENLREGLIFNFSLVLEILDDDILGGTYVSINSSYLSNELARKGIGTSFIGVIDQLRSEDIVRTLLICDRSHIPNENYSVWDKIFNKYPKLKKEVY